MRKTNIGHTACRAMLAMSVTSAALISTLIAGGAAAAPPEPQPNFRWKDGPEVYAKVCSYCHDPQIGPSFAAVASCGIYSRRRTKRQPGDACFRPSEIDDESLAKSG